MWYHGAADLQDEVVACLPTNVTGADMYAVCSDAVLNAIKRTVKEAESSPAATDASEVMDCEESGSVAPARPSKFELTKVDFAQAIANFTPSVTHTELTRYSNLHEQFSTK